jgi:glycosyltransferase involved in cell wall biosynthesis
MRVLMFSWEYPPHLIGGLGAHVAELVPALAAQGVELTLVTPRWRGGEPFERTREGAVIYRVDPPVLTPGNYYADAQQTNLTLEQFSQTLWQEGGYDLVHAHDWLVAPVAEAMKKLHKVPLIATMHATERGRGGGHLGGEMSVAINGLEWWLTYEAWRVIATSYYMANEVRHFFGLPSDKISIIPNGVYPLRFEPLFGQDLERFRSEWALPDEKIVFSVGRMQYEKGLHLLVEAAQRMLARGERVKFILAGRGSMLAPLRQRVAELGLEKHVLLTGYIDNAVRDRLYCVADVAVFPSLYEPFGIVALEAMAAKCPVIVTDVGGLGEVVENSVTGIKIPSYNLDVLVDAISYALRDRAAARERAVQAHALVRRSYGWDHIARDTVELYRDVLKARERVEWE